MVAAQRRERGGRGGVGGERGEARPKKYTPKPVLFIYQSIPKASFLPFPKPAERHGKTTETPKACPGAANKLGTQIPDQKKRPDHTTARAQTTCRNPSNRDMNNKNKNSSVRALTRERRQAMTQKNTHSLTNQHKGPGNRDRGAKRGPVDQVGSSRSRWVLSVSKPLTDTAQRRRRESSALAVHSPSAFFLCRRRTAGFLKRKIRKSKNGTSPRALETGLRGILAVSPCNDAVRFGPSRNELASFFAGALWPWVS